MATTKRFLTVIFLAFLPVVPAFSSSPYSDAASSYPPSHKEQKAAPESRDAVYLKWRSFDPVKEKREEVAPDFQGTEILMARFSDELGLQEIDKMVDKELQFLEKVPVNAYLVKVSREGLSRLKANKKYRYSFRLKPEDKIDPSLIEAGWESPVLLEAVLARGESPLNLISKTKENLFVGALGSVEKGIRLRWLVRPGDLKKFALELADVREVMLVAPFFLPKPLNDDSIWVIQSYDTQDKRNYPLSATIFAHGLLGEGEIAGISDSGLDNDMCYFAYGDGGFATASYPQLPAPGALDASKKVIGYSVLPGATAYDNDGVCGGFVNFHGTHTSGTLAGDNFANLASAGNFGHDTGDGMAPMAKIYFQDVGNDATGCLTGLSNDYGDIFEQAFRAGARIHSDSWGSEAAGNYTTESSVVDEFLYKHEDFSLFFAAGNAGPFSMTLDSPGTGKNCVTVGALIDGSLGSNMVADFSSRGPTADGRIKPDIMAPGQNVTSAAGTSSSSDRNCGFKVMSGTSMATPTAAGGAILLREYFVKGFYPGGEANDSDSFSPSSSLIKASIVAGAMDVGGADIPNDYEGWGRINLDRFTFFNWNERDNLRCVAYDVRNESGLANGEEMSFRIKMEQAGFLKVVLAWLDPEGSPMSSLPLVNNLDLEVVSPGGVTYYGNNFSQGISSTGTSRDDKNNVEGFYLPSGESGTWQIKVIAANVNGTPREADSDRQGFALAVIKPAGLSPVSAPPDFEAVDTGSGGVQLSWGQVPGATSCSVYRIKKGAGTDSPVSFLGMSETGSFSDLKAQGGYAYTYFVRASNGGFEGPSSERITVTSTGNCSMKPVFPGLKSALNDEQTPECDIVLNWDAAVSQCPLDADISYNVYRGGSPDFTPSAATLVASGIKALTCRDQSPPSNRTSFYLVRSEDGSTTGGGPSNGGNEDANLNRVNATPAGPAIETGDWLDDGGDTFALMSAGQPWTVSSLQNHTPFGSYCYSLSSEGEPYPPNTCSSLTTPFIELLGADPKLSYSVRYNLENGWDGVVVGISEDGENFLPVTPDEGYPGSFAYTGNPPLNRCQMPVTQGAFSGPQLNQELTPWALYSHSLSAYSGKSVKIRWQFSSDPASEYEGFFLDDIKITGALLPSSCEGNDAVISFDRQSYGCSDTIFAELYDGKKKGTGKQTLYFSSDSESEPEPVQVVETSPSSGQFAGTIATESLAASADGKLTVKDGDAIYAVYNGNGGSANKEAVADCSAPSLVSLSTVFASAAEIVFNFSSDEMVTAEIKYGRSGQPAQTIKDDLLSDSHRITIPGLELCSDYVYEIKITDIAGNGYTKEQSAFKTKGCFPQPQVASVKSMTDPFRLIISGAGFMQDSIIKIAKLTVPDTVYKSSSKIVAKKGSTLKKMVPKGATVQIVVVNVGDMTSSEPFDYKR
jgi:hypothetical protein